MAHAPTIIAKKLAFLTSQTRLLTTPDPLPTRSWTRANASAEDPLPQRAVDEALARLAHATRQHARRVYPPQAARHVAEQVERLYWEEAGRRSEGVGGDGIGREVDLSMSPFLVSDGVRVLMVPADDAVITRLPPTWPSEREATAHPSESHHYETQTARLAALSDERRQRRARVLRLRRMREALRPFEASLGDGAVQENLLTRGGGLEGELERMRVLLARVAGRVGEAEVRGGEEVSEEVVLGGEGERVERVLRSL